MSKYSDNMPPSLKGAIEWLYDDVEPGSTVLDFGCSTGYFGKYLKDTKKCFVYGLEISEDIKEARKNLDGVYSFDLDGSWPEEVFERKYDALFFGDVIEHLKYPEEVLRKAGKLLKPGAKIFISTPNIAHISTRLELLGGNFEYESMGILDNTHLKYFTKKSLTQLVDSAGYDIVRLDSSTNDYPKEIIKKILKKNGLVAEQKFWDITKSLEARAFQYKLILVKKEQKTAGHSPSKTEIVQKPEQYRDNYISDLKSQIDILKHHAEEQAKIIEHWKQEAEQAQGKISIRNIARKLKKKLKA